jgi:hypothetical protein
MLFYHGCREPIRCYCWLDTLRRPRGGKTALFGAFPLVDITVVPDDEIMAHRRMALLELMQKHIRQRDLMGLIQSNERYYLLDALMTQLQACLLSYDPAMNLALMSLCKRWRNGSQHGEADDYCGAVTVRWITGRFTTRQRSRKAKPHYV